MPAAEVGDRFGYSTASVHQMATLLRRGRLALFAETRPGPKGPRKATGQLRARVLELRAAGHSVAEIAVALAGEGIRSRRRPCGRSSTPRASSGCPAATTAAAARRPSSNPVKAAAVPS